MAHGTGRKIHSVLRWIFTVLVALIFIMMGVQKFFTDGTWTVLFREWGFSDGFRVLIGVGEVGGAVALLWPRFAPLGAATLGAIMCGAVYVRVSDGKLGDVVAILVYMALFAWIGLTRLRDRRA